jgi:hypothetical protein
MDCPSSDRYGIRTAHHNTVAGPREMVQSMRAFHGEALQELAEIAAGSGSLHGCTARQRAP